MRRHSAASPRAARASAQCQHCVTSASCGLREAERVVHGQRGGRTLRGVLAREVR